MSQPAQMDPDIPNQYRSGSRAGLVFLALLGLAAFVAVMPLLVKGRREMLVPKGPAPEIVAAGWINGESPTRESLAGKVVLIDVWATWCGPCRKKLPDLVALHEEYSQRGVVFIGLTEEGESAVDEIKQVLDGAGATWPNGWGARRTIVDLEVRYLPSLFVVGRNGQILWSYDDGGDVQTALELALKEAPPQS